MTRQANLSYWTRRIKANKSTSKCCFCGDDIEYQEIQMVSPHYERKAHFRCWHRQPQFQPTGFIKEKR